MAAQAARQIMVNMTTMLADIDPNAALIDIAGQSRCNGGVPVTIDRTFPDVFDGRVSQVVWSQFCEEVDRGLESMPRIMKNYPRSKYLLLFLYPGIGFFFVVLFAILDWDNLNGLVAVLVSVPLGTFIVLHVLVSCWTRKIVKSFCDVVNDLNELCTRKSKDNTQVSYHIVNTMGKSINMDGGNYVTELRISVKLSDGNNNGNNDGNNNGSDLYAGKNLVSTGQTNTAQRLQELEGIKSLINQEEYNHKRQDILNSV